MKKCLLLLLTFLVCGFAALPLSAQDEESFVLTVADGTVNNDKVPIHGLYADVYQRCQIIYPQTMVSDMANGDISAMEFYFKNSPTSLWTGTFNVMIGTCSDATLGDDFLTGTMTTVYSGTMTVTNNRMIVTFNAPYHYEGGNLLVEFVTNIPGNYKSASFYGMEVMGACLQGHNDSLVSAIGPTQQNFIPKTTFTYVGGAACKAPMGLAVVANEVTAHEATVTWDVVEDLVYDVLYWSEEGDTTVLSDVSMDGNAYTMTGLAPNTTYNAMVQANCEDGVTVKISPNYVSFTTLLAPVELPYMQDFETDPESISDFTFKGNNPARWYIGSATGIPSLGGAEGVHSMYISDDNGIHNQYNNTGSLSYAYAVLNVTFPYDGLEYRVSFDCNVGGEENNDYLAVYVIDGTSEVIPGFYPEGNIVSSKISMTDGWIHKDYSLGNVNGSTKKIVFFWRNDSSIGENPPAAVDNIYIYASACSQPTNFSVTNVTSQNATLKWHDAGGVTSWKVYWRTASDVVYNSFTVTDTTYTFNNLDPNTTYTFYVTSVCMEEESGSTESVTITTPNLPMPIPFDLAFEEEESDFFTYINMQSSNVNRWIIGSDVFAPGEGAGSTTGSSLYISNDGSTYAYSPAINYDAYSYAYMNIEFPEEAMEWHLAFDYKVVGYEYVNYYTINKDALSVYLVDATAAIPSTGLPEGAVVLVNEAYNVMNWTPRDIVLHDVAGTSKKLLFVWHNYTYNTNPTAPAAIDNLRIYANTCTQPSQLTANATSNSVTLSWNEVGASNAWRVYWKQAEDEEFAMVPVTETTHTFSNMTPNTAYTFYVVAICGDEESAATDNLTVTTPNTPVSLPYFEDFETNPESIVDFVSSGTGDNQWSIGAATGAPVEGVEETHSLYISNDNGVSNVYTYNSQTDAYAILSLEFPDDNLEYHIEFDYKVEGEGGFSKWDYFSVYLLDPMMERPTNTSSSDNALIYKSIQSGGWQNYSSILDNVNGKAKSLVFYWHNDGNGGGNPPIAIDNIRIEGLACPQPMNLQVTTTSTNSVTVSWSLMSDTSCTVEYGPAGFEHGQGTMVSGILGGTYTVGGLTPTVPYDVYVRSDCGSDWQGPLYVILGQHEMQAGSDTLYTCNSVIFDDGGATGNYSNSFDGILVLYPETPGSMMMVTGECQIELNGDTLKIYDGVGVGGVLLGSYSGTLQDIAVTSTTGPLTIRFKSDGLSAYPGFELRAQCVTCLTPSNLNVTAITADSAMLTWTPVEDTYSWLVEYKSTLATEWQSQIVLEEPNVQLSELEPGTSYEVKVSTACDDGVYSYPVQTNFATLLSSTPLPYETDFTETADRNWLLNNGTCINRWMIGDVTDTENALYISNNGSDAAYTWTATSVVSAEKLFLVGAAANVDIAFDLQVGGESFYDYLKVFFAPENADFSASTSSTDFSNYSDDLYAVDFSEYAQYSHYSLMESYPYIISRTDTNTVHVEVMMPNPNATPTATSTAKLVFVWVNDISNGKNPGAIISNVSLAGTTCAKPSHLTVSNITGHSAELAWTGSADTWSVEYKKSTSSQWIPVDEPVSTPAFTLTNLDPTTRYDVRVQAVCGEEQLSLFLMTSFTTVEACPAPTNVMVTATNTQAVVSWDGNADNYAVECDTYPVTVDGNTATITGLSASTLYTVTITAICDGDGTSDPLSLNFMTDCDVVNSFPYTEGFENGLGCWTSIPLIDSKNWFVSGEYTADPITTPPVQGDSLAYYKPNAYGTATDLVSPVFDLTALQNPKISFYHIQKPYGIDVDSLEIYYKNSPTAEPVLLAGYNEMITYWRLDSISLPDPTAEYQIIFRGFGSWGRGIGLDSITVYDRPGVAPVLIPPTVITDTALNVTGNAATLKANIVNQDNVPILAQGFQWRIMIGGTYDFVPATVTDNAMSAELTDLAPETAYRFRAYVITATDTIYGELKNFTTLEEEVEPCATPTGLGTSNITKESITVSWDAAEGVSSWNLRYRKQGDEQFITKNTESHTYVINNLLPETTYEIQVQADCGDDNESQWSELITETTLPDGVNSYMENSILLYPNPAKEVVNVQCTMNDGQFNGVEIEVLDVYGKLLQTLKVSSENTRINVSSLANGIYFVRVITEQGAVTKRFVKQ